MWTELAPRRDLEDDIAVADLVGRVLVVLNDRCAGVEHEDTEGLRLDGEPLGEPIRLKSWILEDAGPEGLAYREACHERLAEVLGRVREMELNDIYFLMQELVELIATRPTVLGMEMLPHALQAQLEPVEDGPTLAIGKVFFDRLYFFARRPRFDDVWPDWEAYYFNASERYGVWGEEGECPACGTHVWGSVKVGRCPFCGTRVGLT